MPDAMMPEKNARKQAWLRNALGWDGVLPLLVALSLEILPLALPGRDMPELAAVLGVPMVAALIRAHQGGRQLEAICPGEPAWGRQLLFGLAIVLLLVFEGLVGLLRSVKNAGNLPWFLA